MHVLKQQLSSLIKVVCFAFPSVIGADTFSIDSLPDGLNSSCVKRMYAILQSKQSLLEQNNGRDITVVLGNTGSGKSTMINVLAGSPMRVDLDGRFIPESGQEKVRVRTVGGSVTKFPELILETEIGDLCDLPGFQDSGGAVDDLLNAVFMREVLTRARSVRALILTTQDELIAVRADPFRKLSLFVNLFQEREFRNSACYLIVNKVERSLIARNRTQSLFDGVYGNLEEKDLFLKELVDSERVFFIPAARSPATPEEGKSEKERLLEIYSEMVRRVVSVQGRNVRVQELNMEFPLNGDTLQTLVMFFHKLMTEHLDRLKDNIFQNDLRLSLIDDHEYSWNHFQSLIMKDSSLLMLYPFSSKAYESASTVFRLIFDKKYDFYQQTILVEELRKKTQQAEIDTKLAEEKHREAQERIRENIKKTAELEKAQAEAERKTKQYVAEAQEALNAVDKHQADIERAEAEARKEEEYQRQAQESIKRNDAEKRAAIEFLRQKAEELERLKQKARNDELKKQEALERAKQAEEDKRRIEEEITQHLEYVRQTREYKQQAETYVQEVQKAQEQAKINASQMQIQLRVIQKSLESRDIELSQLHHEIERLRREQGDVSSLRREIEDLSRKLIDKDRQISRLRSNGH